MWQESNTSQRFPSGEMTDVVFRIQCPRLRVDHAAALQREVQALTQLLSISSKAGIHPIWVAGSQNGWERPEAPTEELLLSKRTKFCVRIDAQNADALIQTLSGKSLDIDGYNMLILSGQVRPITPSATLLSRYTYFSDSSESKDESLFIQKVFEQCESLDYTPTKILCGREHTIKTEDGPVITRSVLLADIPVNASITLQDNGLGMGRKFGCGLLIPHKDTGAVN